MMTMTTMSNKMENTMNAIATILSNLNGATICGVTYMSEPKMNKTGNPYFGRVIKVASVSLQFGYNYENAVNNREEKVVGERTFESEKLPWGEWVVVNKIISHKGELYGRFYKIKGQEENATYLIDGRVASESEVEGIKSFMPTRKESAKQASVGVVENQVKPMNIKLGNIISLRVNGVEVVSKAVEVAVAER